MALASVSLPATTVAPSQRSLALVLLLSLVIWAATTVPGAVAQTTLVGLWAETSPDNYGGTDAICIDPSTLQVTASYSNIGYFRGTATPDMRNMTGNWFEPHQQGTMTLYMVGNNAFSGSWAFSDGSGGGVWSGSRLTSTAPSTCTATYQSIAGYWTGDLLPSTLAIAYTGTPTSSFPLPFAGTVSTVSGTVTSNVLSLTLGSGNGGRTATGTFVTTRGRGSAAVSRDDNTGNTLNLTLTYSTGESIAYGSLVRVLAPVVDGAAQQTNAVAWAVLAVVLLLLLVVGLGFFLLANRLSSVAAAGSGALAVRTVTNPLHKPSGSV